MTTRIRQTQGPTWSVFWSALSLLCSSSHPFIFYLLYSFAYFLSLLAILPSCRRVVEYTRKFVPTFLSLFPRCMTSKTFNHHFYAHFLRWYSIKFKSVLRLNPMIFLLIPLCICKQIQICTLSQSHDFSAYFLHTSKEVQICTSALTHHFSL